MPRAFIVYDPPSGLYNENIDPPLCLEDIEKAKIQVARLLTTYDYPLDIICSPYLSSRQLAAYITEEVVRHGGSFAHAPIAGEIPYDFVPTRKSREGYLKPTSAPKIKIKVPPIARILPSTAHNGFTIPENKRDKDECFRLLCDPLLSMNAGQYPRTMRTFLNADPETVELSPPLHETRMSFRNRVSLLKHLTNHADLGHRATWLLTHSSVLETLAYCQRVKDYKPRNFDVYYIKGDLGKGSVIILLRLGYEDIVLRRF